jgi:hypothetical protein
MKVAYAYSNKIVCYINNKEVSTVYPQCISRYNLALIRTRSRGYIIIKM